MSTIIISLATAVFIFFLIKGILNARHKKESKLGIFEHPATFKKPEIGMTSRQTDEKKKNDGQFNSTFSDNKEE